MSDRLRALEEMVEKRPENARARFGLALEYLGTERWEDAVRELRAYLELTEDEGNAWGRLGDALFQLGREEEATEAYRSGIEAALHHGHPSMASEFEEILEDRGLAGP